MHHGDTIAAISTPPGRGGIGIVRLSGTQALKLAGRVFETAAGELDSPGRARFGHVVEPETRERIDEAVATWFRAPHSYTGEDVVEISCHGSPVVLRRLLLLLLDHGARLAEPGEFTFRAFFNGRIDLSQAQAVRDLIEAQTEFQARVATLQLEGSLSRRLQPIKQELVDIAVHLESSIEFVEDDISPEVGAELLRRLSDSVTQLEPVAASFSFGKLLREGFDLAIVGRPNVGKSSVFNRLIGTDRAIVTEVPGTTRDTLHESASIGGVPVRFIDTAGIRDTVDVVESIGVRRSRSAMGEADVCLLVLDISLPLESGDETLLNEVPRERRIVVLNKIDLVPGDRREVDFNGAVRISALTGEGFDKLTRTIIDRLAGEERPVRDDVLITDARQYQAIRRAIDELGSARETLAAGEPEEVVMLKLRAALNALGEVTGETLTDDILARIFSTFCIGK